jgi:hypothetical protein
VVVAHQRAVAVAVISKSLTNLLPHNVLIDIAKSTPALSNGIVVILKE